MFVLRHIVELVLQISWFKDGHEVSEDRCQVTTSHGVCTLEIYNSKTEDAGKYSCSATNSLGDDETSCVVSIQSQSGNTTVLNCSLQF